MTTAVRNGHWMQTYTGRAFYPLDARPDEIDPQDIAHALGMTCRYGGHTRKFYSVAEHCVLMSQAVAPENAIWALLHDATEAYIGDVIRPIKVTMPEYNVAESLLMRVICERFGLEYGPLPDEVKLADNRILLTERNTLLPPPPLSWGEYIEELEPLPVTLECWSPSVAKRQYLKRLHELTA